MVRCGPSRTSTRSIAARTDTVGRPGGDLGPAANAGHASDLVAGKDHEVTDFTAADRRRAPGPFTPRQLSRLDEALTLSSRETGLDFSVWVGELEEPTREHAERLHAGLPRPAEGVLIAVSPGQRVLHIVTGEHSSRRLPDRAAASGGAVDAGLALGRRPRRRAGQRAADALRPGRPGQPQRRRHPAGPAAPPRRLAGRLSGQPVDRHVRAGLGGELGAGPVRVPALQLEAGELGHQVELGRPDVAVRAAEQLRLRAVAEPEVVRDDLLVHTSYVSSPM